MYRAPTACQQLGGLWLWGPRFLDGALTHQEWGGSDVRSRLPYSEVGGYPITILTFRGFSFSSIS